MLLLMRFQRTLQGQTPTVDRQTSLVPWHEHFASAPRLGSRQHLYSAPQMMKRVGKALSGQGPARFWCKVPLCMQRPGWCMVSPCLQQPV